MIFKDAKRQVDKLIKDWNVYAGDNVRMKKSRYYILIGGLMYTEDFEQIGRDVVGELEIQQMMNRYSNKSVVGKRESNE